MLQSYDKRLICQTLDYGFLMLKPAAKSKMTSFVLYTSKAHGAPYVILVNTLSETGSFVQRETADLCLPLNFRNISSKLKSLWD